MWLNICENVENLHTIRMTDAILLNFFRNIFNLYVVSWSCFFFINFYSLLSIDSEIKCKIVAQFDEMLKKPWLHFASTK